MLNRWFVEQNYEIIERNVKQRTTHKLEALLIANNFADLYRQKKGVYDYFCPDDVFHCHFEYVMLWFLLKIKVYIWLSLRRNLLN